jgi:O-antigen ligase
MNSRVKRIGLLVLGLVSTYLMVRTGAKQGIVDFLLIFIACIGYQLRGKYPKFVLSRNIWTAFLTFATLLWCEIVYLVPIARLPIPGIAGDINVTIRSDFWYSGGAMFFNNFWFGVGPDGYGYFYEKYRSLSSVKKTESVISNDAHSAMVQSISTLGIFGIIAFIALIVVLIKSLVVLGGEEPESKRRYLIFALFFFIYLTNSLISPITLPNKSAFWALAGYVVGRACSYGVQREVNLPVKLLAVPMALVVAFVLRLAQMGKHARQGGLRAGATR